MSVSRQPNTHANRLELLLLSTIWILWIVVFVNGKSNGMGYFQQPENDLLLPMINGGIFNAILFYLLVFWLIPTLFQKKLWLSFWLALLVVTISYLILKTLIEKIIIFFKEPELLDVTWLQLMRENFYMLLAFTLFSIMYRMARDWISQFNDVKTTQNDSPESESAIPATELFVKSGNQTLSMDMQQVLYIKSAGNYLEFVENDRKTMVHMTITEAAKKLKPINFSRIHRSYLVNLNHIETISNKKVTVWGNQLPVSAKYEREFSDHLSRVKELL